MNGVRGCADGAMPPCSAGRADFCRIKFVGVGAVVDRRVTDARLRSDRRQLGVRGAIAAEVQRNVAASSSSAMVPKHQGGTTATIRLPFSEVLHAA